MVMDGKTSLGFLAWADVAGHRADVPTENHITFAQPHVQLPPPSVRTKLQCLSQPLYKFKFCFTAPDRLGSTIDDLMTDDDLTQLDPLITSNFDFSANCPTHVLYLSNVV